MHLRPAFVLLHLDSGGFERVVLQLLTHLDRRRFAPSLVLLHGTGSLCELVPPDVTIERLAVRARRAVLTLVGSLRRLRPDVVFSGTTSANLAALAAASLARRSGGGRLPVVVNQHTAPSLFFAEVKHSRVYRLLMRHLYPRAARIGVPILEVGAELRRELRRPQLPIVELRNPLFDESLEALAAASPAVPLPPSPVFVAAGRLVAPKGFDVLIEAFARLPIVPRPPHLVLLGEGPERGHLESLSRSLGIADRVLLPGTVINPFPFFRRAAALVVSSRREAIPNVILESMACGTPVIATDCWSGPRRLLEDGGAGLLVPPGDAPALTEAMARLLADPALAKRLAARGRQRAERHHVDATVPDFEHLLDEVAAEARDGAQRRHP